jgi:hypothetical protein
MPPSCAVMQSDGRQHKSECCVCAAFLDSNSYRVACSPEAMVAMTCHTDSKQYRQTTVL